MNVLTTSHALGKPLKCTNNDRFSDMDSMLACINLCIKIGREASQCINLYANDI